MQGVKSLKIETGLSRNSDGTWNGHIILHWPDRPKDAYYFPGEPGKPFRTDREANAWCQNEVKNLVQKIGVEQRNRRAAKLISV